MKREGWRAGVGTFVALVVVAAALVVVVVALPWHFSSQ